MTPALKAHIEGWLKKTEHDIISAQRLLEIEPVILDSACFHSQQAIEKCLKAFLAFHGQEIERTHNIIFLPSECSNYDSIFTDIDPGKLTNMPYKVVIQIPLIFIIETHRIPLQVFFQ